MRVLLLLRGLPGSGKSTWVRENGLLPYAISSDAIRLLYRSPIYNVDGNLCIDQGVNKESWRTLYEILEYRLSKGEFTVVDACNVTTDDLNIYKSYAEKYKYRVFCIDFTVVEKETAKEQNKQREEMKVVPNDVIELFAERLSGSHVPSGIKVLDKDNWFDEIKFNSVDLSGYKKVCVIGDVHGCFTALNELLCGKINQDTYYIFVGDYIDRGIENKEVLELLFGIVDLPNVCLLEGNHEKWLAKFANGEQITKKAFLLGTQKQIECLDKKQMRYLYRKLRQCILFDYQGVRYLVTHAGLSNIGDKNLIFMSTDSFINGVGTYEDVYECHKSFASKTDIVQIHGHRNPKCLPIYQDGAYNLEGQVEFGGHLRAVEISESGVREIEIKNNVFDKERADLKKLEKGEDISSVGIPALVEKLRKDKKLIVEKNFGNISSFNFTKGVFYDKHWNNITTKARGLFINLDNYTICARAYEKFFNINEKRETELENLKKKFAYPLSCFLKYNGFLGILGYDEKQDKLLFCSKSTVGGEFADLFEKIFMSNYADKYDEVLKFVKDNNVSLVFEVIDKDNDPHIIENKQNKIVLLDVVKRELKFEKMPYSELVEFAGKFGFEVKELCFTLQSAEQFENWYNEISASGYKYKGEFVEGFVLVDSENYMTKVKGEYYNFWKYMRSIAEDVFKVDENGNFVGFSNRGKKLTNETAILFYDYILKLASENYQGKKDIITLRNLFFENQNQTKND